MIQLAINLIDQLSLSTSNILSNTTYLVMQLENRTQFERTLHAIKCQNENTFEECIPYNQQLQEAIKDNPASIPKVVSQIQNLFCNKALTSQEEIQKQKHELMRYLKFLKDWLLISSQDFRKTINQMVSNLINYEWFAPRQQINIYKLLENQRKNYSVLGKMSKQDLKKQETLTLKFIQDLSKNCQFMKYTIFYLQKQQTYSQIISENSEKNFKIKSQRSKFELILNYIIKDSEIDQFLQQIALGKAISKQFHVSKKRIYKCVFFMAIKQRFQQIIEKIRIHLFSDNENKSKGPFSIHQSMILHEHWIQKYSNVPLRQVDNKKIINEYGPHYSINNLRGDYQLRINQRLKCQFFEELYNTAKLLIFNKENERLSETFGLYSVEDIKYAKSSFKVHLKGMEIHKTANFAQLKQKDAKQLFYKLLCPRNKDKILLKSEQAKTQKVFSHDDAQNVIKTLIKRIKIGLYNATKKGIKASLLLLRHLIFDLNYNQQDYPNPLVYINILQSFIDANHPNSKQQNFILQFYLNQKIKRLGLPCEEHNMLICEILLLSLISKKNEKQFLNIIYSKINEEAFYIKSLESIKKVILQIYNCFNITVSKNHGRVYINSPQKFDMVNLFATLIVSQTGPYIQPINNLQNQQSRYQDFLLTAQQVTIPSQGDFVTIKSSYVIGENLNQPPNYYFKMVYQKNNIQKASMPLQQQAAQSLLSTTYNNFLYLKDAFRLHNIRHIRQVLQVGSIPQPNAQPHEHFMVLFASQTSPIFILKRKERSYFQHYIDQPSIHNTLIKEKSQYFINLSKPAKKRFIINLFQIAEQLRLLGIEPIVLNLAQIAFISQNQDIFYQENPTAIRPAIEHLTFFRVIEKNHIVANNQAFTQIFRNLPRNHEIFTQNCPLNVWNNQHYSRIFNGVTLLIPDTEKYHIGSLGFILCLLLFRRQQQEEKEYETLKFDKFQRDYDLLKRHEGNLRIIYENQLDQLLRRDYVHNDNNLVNFLMEIMCPNVNQRMHLQNILAAINLVWP